MAGMTPYHEPSKKLAFNLPTYSSTADKSGELAF